MVESLCLVTILLSIVAVKYNWERNRAVIFLAGALILFSFFIFIVQITVYGESEIVLALFFNNFQPLYILPGPLLYFYFRAITQDSIRFHWYDALHLIPFIITFIGNVPYVLSPWSHKLEVARIVMDDPQGFIDLKFNYFIPVVFNQYLRPILFFSYALASLILVLKFRISDRDKANEVLLAHYKSIKRWAVIVLISIMVSAATFAVAVHLFLDDDPTLFKTFGPLWLQVSTIVFALIPLSLIIYPNVIYGFVRLGNDVNQLTGNDQNIDDATEELAKEIKQESLSPEKNQELEVLKDIIIGFMDEHKPYVNPHFKLVDIAHALNVPAHHISYCFTKAFDESFTQFRTRYRVEHAALLLQEGAADQYSMEGIGKMSGFTSKSHFFTSFKEHTGLTPQQYIVSNNQ